MEYTAEQQHKIKTLNDEFITNCPKCKGKEYIMDGDDKRRCDCRLKLWEFGYAVMGRIPRRYWYNQIEMYPGFVSENPKHGKIKEWMLGYVNNFEKYLLDGMGISLFGGYKVGKTSLLCHVLWRYMSFKKQSEGSFYCTAREIDAVWHNEEDMMTGFTREDVYKSSGVIFIDEIGGEYHYGYKGQMKQDEDEFSIILSEIIKRRNGNKLITLLASKKNIDQFSSSYGVELLDTIRESMFVREFPKDNSLQIPQG